MRVYDCFQFFNELDLLEIRLDLLYDHVDYFVISETNKTHSNLDKRYIFEDNKHYFQKYMDKIIHIKTEYPDQILNMGIRDESSLYDIQYNRISKIYDIEENEGELKKYPTFCRDYLQREFIKFGLLGCSDDDLIMVSDLDEIPNPKVVDDIRRENKYDCCIMQNCFYYNINTLAHTNWYGNYVVKYSSTKDVSLTHLRNKRVGFEKISDNAGWHLSFMGGPDRVRTKIESYAHQEFNNSNYKNNIEEKIKSMVDVYNRRSYGDSIQEFYFDKMKEVNLNIYPTKMLNLIKDKYNYLIKNVKHGMDKIVITGGLGYIGTELCKLYSGEARYKNIVVLDHRFVSERVSQLTDWGITFIQGSILDEKLVKSVISDADYVFHLAGITDVAYVKSQSDKNDDEIRESGVVGTRNIINNAPGKCKIIFPSTHVVYEGFQEATFDITEDVEPNPVLVYSTGKVQSEIDLKKSNLDYIILRLGSVYGYSTDTMRINIMPNLFSKISSQNGTISLFSGGVQHKSLIYIFDVVRAMKFMAESDIHREIFHLSNENMTIKEVADICKKYNPNVKLISTADEIPNLGSTLSNKKLLSTGFKFLYNIDQSIKEMIQKWSTKPQPKDLEYILRGEKEYIDDRGKISNYELTEPINLIGYIESKRGSVRANHYHPIQEQKCLLIKGKYISVIKDLSIPNDPIKTKLIKAGDLAVIRPNVAHTMVFLEDSIFLNLVCGEREHDNYGITHTIPYVLVDEEMRKDLLQGYKIECRSCGSIELKDVISLGMSPLANNLLDSSEDRAKMYPLEVKYCDNCKNAQLSFVVPPQEMFDNYLYVSSTAASFRKHFEDASIKFIEEFNLNSDSLVVDIGSNDGVFLNPLKDRGIKVLGVEPAKNIAEMANNKGIPTLNSYFNEETANKVVESYGNPKIITAFNVFAHSDELVEIAHQVFNILDDEGIFIIEVQYLLDTIKDLTFDNIYHEHVNYWSVTSLNNFFNRLGYTLFKVEHVNTHGGSIRGYIKRNGSVDSSVKEFIQNENDFGISKYNLYREFADNVHQIKMNVNENIHNIKSKYSKIAAYGSPAKATTSLNFFNVNSEVIKYTIEDNELKNGKFIPGVNIPIVNKQYALQNLPEVIIVLAWNFFEDIKRNNKDLIEMGVKFISIKDLQNSNFTL